MSDPVNIPVREPVMTATKAVVATITTVGGWVALLVTAMGDGGIGSAEVGTLVTGALTAIATIGGVWGVKNKMKKV
jgi:hypothetical protein